MPAVASDASQQSLTRRRREAEENLRDIENQILADSLVVVRDAIDFHSIEADEKAVPAEWVEELGEERAKRKFRVAKGAWMSTKDAPNGILVAMKMASAIVSARSAEKAAPKALSITWIQQAAPGEVAAAYPELVVEAQKE